MDAIKTNNLSKHFGNFKAVDNINLNVPKGSVYGFIGKNGAGKTTTISMILGLIKTTNGEIFVNGKKIGFNEIEYKEKIGYLCDVPNFYDFMTAKEYLTFVAKLTKVDKSSIENKVNELLRFVGLDDIKQTIGGFSRGMKQRLGISAALINDPEIIILDEPTSALDPIGRKELMDIIMKLKGEKTVFYSTHILTDVERVCDMVGIINKGKIILEKSMQQIQSELLINRVFVHTDRDIVNFVKQSNFYVNHEEVDNGVIFEVSNEQLMDEFISKLIVEKSLILHEYKKIKRTLEDVFFEVINNENTN